MTNGERFLNVAGSLASLAALGYLLLHLPKRGKRVAVEGLRGLPEFPELRFDVEGDPEEGYAVSAKAGPKKVGRLITGACATGRYSPVDEAEVARDWRGRGLYPVLLTKARDAAKRDGCAGIVSRVRGRSGTQSTESWEKFAERESRVHESNGDYYLDGLPTRGRIPLDTVKRAMKRLPKRYQSCGITPSLLREGMEIEREHAYTTKGAVGATARVSADHLCEQLNYYKKLKKYVE